MEKKTARSLRLERAKSIMEKSLTQSGPMRKTDLELHMREIFGCKQTMAHLMIRDILSENTEKFGIAKIGLGTGSGGQGRHKFSSFQLFDGISAMHIGPIIWLRGDNRLISFVCSKIIKPKTPEQVRSLRFHLNRIFGKKLARQMIDFTGYKYRKGYKH